MDKRSSSNCIEVRENRKPEKRKKKQGLDKRSMPAVIRPSRGPEAELHFIAHNISLDEVEKYRRRPQVLGLRNQERRSTLAVDVHRRGEGAAGEKRVS